MAGHLPVCPLQIVSAAADVPLALIKSTDFIRKWIQANALRRLTADQCFHDNIPRSAQFATFLVSCASKLATLPNIHLPLCTTEKVSQPISNHLFCLPA